MDKYYKNKFIKLLQELTIIIINYIILSYKSSSNENNLKDYLNHLLVVSKLAIKMSLFWSLFWYITCLILLNNRRRFFAYVDKKFPILIDQAFS